MNRRFVYSLSILLLCTGCSTGSLISGREHHENEIISQEFREELADIKHLLNNTRLELQLLEESIEAKEAASKKTGSRPSDSKVVFLENRVAELVERLSQTIRELEECQNKIGELERVALRQSSLLSEITRLRSSISSLTDPSERGKPILYKVRPGDSLEKIAKLHKVSVSSLKEENRLADNKILIGQELKIPTKGSP